jgi:hypothetical protein
VRQIHEQHPWMTTAGAAVAGFVAASLLVPSKEETALKKLAKWEKALRAAEGRAEAAPAAQHAASSNGNGEVGSNGRPQKKGLLSTLATELIRSVAPALASALTAGMATKAENNEPGHAGFPGDDTAVPPNAP